MVTADGSFIFSIAHTLKQIFVFIFYVVVVLVVFDV